MVQSVKSIICLVIIGIVSILFSARGYARDLSKFTIAATEEGAYRTLLKKTGEVIWQARWSVNKTSTDGRDIVKITEKGKGKYNDLPGAVSWIMETSFFMENNPPALNAVRTVFGPHHKEIWKKSKTFDNARKMLIAEQFEGGKLKMKKIVPFPGMPAYPSDLLAYVLRGYNFQARDPFSFYLFTVDAKLFRAQIRQVGREVVHVPAGTFDTYKMELVLDLGFVNVFIKYFLPKTHMWLSVNDPHVCVKYEGLEGGIGSPYVVMELLNFTP
jgi:hypothetical protein